MTLRVGYIPYLNMAPFHHGFGPKAITVQGHVIEFPSLSPRVLGLKADKGEIDAGALSIVDWLRLESQFEPLGSFGIGTKGPAQSVLLFSKRPMAEFEGTCAVTDETSTSFRLLQILLEVRHKRTGVQYGRIASSMLFDGSAQGLLLIGDEAIQVKKDGVPGLPVVTDLGSEWFDWQQVPFVFARWAMRKNLDPDVKALLMESVENSLNSNESYRHFLAENEASIRSILPREIADYWNGFAYRLTAEHERSIALFASLMEKAFV